MFFLRKHIVAFFFLLTYLISWGCWFAAARFPSIGFVGLLAIGAFGPAIAGFVCTAIVGGRDGLADLVRRIFGWRLALKAYLFAFSVPFLLAYLPLVVYSFIGGPAVQTEKLVFLPALIPVFLGMFIAGGLNEEPGWRGFALPVLRAKHGSLVASLVIGIFWGMWHIPLYVMGEPILIASLIGFILLVMVISLLFTALANATDDSVWIAIIFHAAYNTFLNNLPSLLGVPRSPQHQMIAVLLVVAMVFVVLMQWRRAQWIPIN